MRVAAIELPARYGDPDGQLRSLDRALSALPPGGPTLAVLPELALTGYVSPRGDFDVSRFAQGLDGPLLRAVAGLAVAREVALLASWVERDGARCFNSAALIDEAGATVLHYRKRHPWYPETWAKEGDLGTPVATIHGRRVAVAVCFDIHFVSGEAGEALDTLDALLFPSAWVDDEDEDEDARGSILPALALGHGCAVVNANWGRGTPRVPGQGGSRIVLGDGVTVGRTTEGEGARVVVASLPARRRLPVGRGAVKRPRS